MSIPSARLLIPLHAVLGLLAVILGAIIAHLVRGVETDLPVDPKAYDELLTAQRYHLVHALAGFAAALAACLVPAAAARWFARASLMFAVGTVLFCGAIYGYRLLGSEVLRWMAPVGGTSLMVAWVLVAYGGWRLPPKQP